MNKKFDIYEWLNDNYDETKDTYKDIAKELAMQLYDLTSRETYHRAMQDLKDNLDHIFEEEETKKEEVGLWDGWGR